MMHDSGSWYNAVFWIAMTAQLTVANCVGIFEAAVNSLCLDCLILISYAVLYSHTDLER